jgi:hypothetical protein
LINFLGNIFLNYFFSGLPKKFSGCFWSFFDVFVFFKYFGKFQITNQQITIQTKFSGLKIEDIPKKNMQQCAAKFAAPDFPI